jgi:flavoprotein
MKEDPMKSQMVKLVFGTILVMTVIVAGKAASLSTNCPQGNEKAKISGTVVSRSALGGKKYSIFVKLKDCKCEECKGKCSDCCIPQATIDSDDDGKFQHSLGPGTYTVEVSGHERSRVEIEVSAGQSKTVTLTTD